MRTSCVTFSLVFYFSFNLAGENIFSRAEDIFTKFVDRVFPTRCFKNLGCFNSGPPFYNPIWRPASVVPQRRCKPKFLLYTPSNPSDPQNGTMDDTSAIESTYDAQLPTKFIVHGYNITIDANSIVITIKDELLKAGKFNVIVVIWDNTTHCLFPYVQAIANARKVGAEIAYLLTVIEKSKGLNYEDVHLIGHSLGAHVCGFAGERIDKIGRITGLDPAGPFYEHAPPEVRLDKTDASFVDVIHTDEGELAEGKYGLPQNLGHEDFYPNGWKEQPACKNDSKGLSNKIQNTENVCEHIMSQKYFLTSINECQFLGVQCESYQQFQDGVCNKDNSLVAQMGYYAKKIEDIKGEAIFFLKTTAESPYCFPEDRVGPN